MRDLKAVLFLAISSFMGQVSAPAADSIDRLGRLWGFGWSDGYHACRDNGYEVGENLPPMSYSHRNSLHPAVSCQKVVQNQPGFSHGQGCANGDCNQDWAPEAWQGNLDLEMTVNQSPSIAPDPVPLQIEPQVVPPARTTVPVETLPTPKPTKAAKPLAKPEADDDDLLLDDDLTVPPAKPTRKAPILNDAEDSLLPDEPGSPSDSDLGSYLNSQNRLSPYRTMARPVRNRQISSQR